MGIVKVISSISDIHNPSPSLSWAANDINSSTKAGIAPGLLEGLQVPQTQPNGLTLWEDQDGLDELYFSCYYTSRYYDSGSTSSSIPLEFFCRNTSGSYALVFALYNGQTYSGGRYLRARIHLPSGTSESSLYQIGGSTNVANVVPTRVDVHIRVHQTDGIFRVLIGGQQAFIFRGNTKQNRYNAVNRIVFNRSGSYLSTETSFLSGAILSTTNTFKMKLQQRRITGFGGDRDWRGTYTDVNEYGLDTLKSIRSVDDGERSSFTMSNIPVNAYRKFNAVVHSMNALNPRENAASVSSYIKTPTSEYHSEPKIPKLATFDNYQFVYEISQLEDYTPSRNTINTSEMGFTSISNKNPNTEINTVNQYVIVESSE